ncbi:MAG TPA: lipase family protein [Allosphingosinicella sp.]|nr:lipase family protein [Allosphingosinicella sp.]
MSDQTCLRRHLLHAAVETYHPDGPLYSGAPARWTGSPPARIDAPGIDFALVGRFAEGIVAAFRGTLPPLDLSPDGRRILPPGLAAVPRIVADWGNDANAIPRRGIEVAGEILPGRVHAGFAGSLVRLWDGVAAAIDRLRGPDPAPRLYFTGHSKGGALANLAAVRARRAWPGATIKAVTFGAPRAGDADFARAYAAAAVDGQRYEVEGDIVAGVPRSGVPVGAPHGVALVAALRLPSAALHGLFRPIEAHLPYRGFGYDRHVYETGAAPEWF